MWAENSFSVSLYLANLLQRTVVNLFTANILLQNLIPDGVELSSLSCVEGFFDPANDSGMFLWANFNLNKPWVVFGMDKDWRISQLIFWWYFGHFLPIASLLNDDLTYNPISLVECFLLLGAEHWKKYLDSPLYCRNIANMFWCSYHSSAYSCFGSHLMIYGYFKF